MNSAELETQILKTDNEIDFDMATVTAAQALKNGDLVVIPTETVYGLAANALNPRAVESIFKVKKRPPINPIIVHVDSINMALECVSLWTSAADALAKAFWPGPLTMIMPKAEHIPDIITAGGGTVGVRMPALPICHHIIRRCGFPLAAPSANISSELSPTCAEHVMNALKGKIPYIVDAGPCPVGIESTVIDMTVLPPVILRPGMVSAESISGVIGSVDSGRHTDEAVRRSPGLMHKHYSPKSKLFVFRWRDEDELIEKLNKAGYAPEHTHLLIRSIAYYNANWCGIHMMPDTAAAYAKGLYAELHNCDKAGAKAIVVEEPPDSDEWSGIHDRLKRAAGDE